MRRALAIFALAACGSKDKDAPPTPPRVAADAAVAADASTLPAHDAYADLAAAIGAIVPADARVIGFGELHARVDRAQVPSALSRFTAALPAFGDKISDLVVETWIVDPKCGPKATKTTAKLEKDVKRPAATKNEITLLADAARAAAIQPHAMTLQCKDYDKLAPKQGAPDPIAMLDLTTRELQRIAASAVRHRDKQANHRPWIALYGGALHNDRFPVDGVEMWSYAAKADETSGDKFVEIDLIVPELAEADEPTKKQPWYPVVQKADDQVHVWQRGERSFVVVLPRSPAAK